jgi:hypothetical protein
VSFSLAVHLPACFGSKIAGIILMEFDVDVMPLRVHRIRSFLLPTIGNTNMAEVRTCETAATLTLPSVGV